MSENNEEDGRWTRDQVLVVVLGVATAILLFLCWQIVRPFVTPIVWAVALAVVAHPLHGWIDRYVRESSIAAGIAVILVAIALVLPAAFVGHAIVQEATGVVHAVQVGLESGQWRQQLAQHPRYGPMLTAVEQRANLAGQIHALAGEVGRRVGHFVAGSAWAVVQLLLTLFVLFYLFRDRAKALRSARSLVPLSQSEVDRVFRRVSDTVHATIYGTLVVAAVQGSLGGLMFWWLGLPAPVLWGAVMGLLAIVPVLGAFVIWVPAAIFLAVNGLWGKAIILTLWGGVFIALIDNLIYPILVGNRLRLHTVPVFFAIVGGLGVFGAAGLILGPVVLALTSAILDIWRRRTEAGRPAEAAVGKT